MRTYGRNQDDEWQVVETTADGNNDLVYIVTLCQCLYLFLGESPFYANYGVPSHVSVVTQVFPDYFVTRTQGQFSQYFASLVVAKLDSPTPTYQINVVTNGGVPLAVTTIPK